jgi:hypothetical protein
LTSPRKLRSRAEAKAEQEIFDMLPSTLRAAINEAPRSVRASVVYEALLRGVSEQAIIETISKRSPQ